MSTTRLKQLNVSHLSIERSKRMYFVLQFFCGAGPLWCGLLVFSLINLCLNPALISGDKANDQSMDITSSDHFSSIDGASDDILHPFPKLLPVDLKLKLNPEEFYENVDLWKENITLTSVPMYPASYIFAKMASAVYIDYKEGESQHDYEKRLDLPSGWKLLTTASNTGILNCYFGAAFWHPKHQQLIIAHRGTTISFPLLKTALYADLMEVVMNKYGAQMHSAITFADKIVETLSNLNEGRGINFQLFFTGHSLGGWLAQVTTLTVEYMFRDGEFFQKTQQPKPSRYHAHTVVFDSPGCEPMLSKIISDFDVRYSDRLMDKDSLDITSYLSAPNRINTLNAHVGNIYRIFIDFSEITWLERNTIKYTLIAHAMDRILQEFDPKTGHVRSDESGRLKVVEVDDWPISGFFHRGEEYDTFFELAKPDNNYHPVIFLLHSTIGTTVSYPFRSYLRYQTTPVNETSGSLNVFTKTERQFLEHYQRLRILPEIFQPQELFDTSDATSRDRLQDYTITEKSIRCSTAETLQKLIPYVKYLLRLFPDIPEKAARMLSSDNIQIQFFQVQTKNYLHQANQMPIIPITDNLGLENFLNSKDQKIWLLTVDGDTSLALTWTFKIFENIQEKSVIYKEMHYTVLILKQHSSTSQMMADVHVLFKNCPHLLIFVCEALNDGAKEQLKTLFQTVQSSQDIKLILITTVDKEAEKLLEQGYASPENFIITKFPQLNWNDLTRVSQEELVRLSSLLPGIPIPCDRQVRI